MVQGSGSRLCVLGFGAKGLGVKGVGFRVDQQVRSLAEEVVFVRSGELWAFAVKDHNLGVRV